MGRSPACMVLCAATLALAGAIARPHATAQPHDIATLVTRVGDRVAAYYRRAQQLICTERSTVTPIGSNLGVDGFARTVESELRLEVEVADDGELPSVRMTRQVRRVNGREPRDRDKRDRSGCTDPTPLSPELLTFLLPGHRDEYRFTAVRDGRERDRAALIIDFATAQRRSGPELIEDELGHDDCFDWKGAMSVTGRVWVDALTHDVLRLDRRISGPTDISVPNRLQQKYRFPPWLTLDRDDLTMRYKEVTFTDPEETLLLPESAVSVTVVRSGLQSARRTQVFTDYQRFLTASRIKGR